MSIFSGMDPARREMAMRLARERVEEARAGATEELIRLELELERRKLDDLKYFIHKAWSIVEPKQVLIWNWHLDVLCQEVMIAFRTADYKCVINIPPGTMKSLLVSVMFRAYLWSKDPTLRFLTGSYGSSLSIEHNVKLRDIIQSEWYQKLFPQVRITGDQNAKERFDTTAGGWSFATSVGGAGTGEHPNYIIVDDPLTEAEARSQADRTKANNWIDRTLSSRGLAIGARTILIMQRFHEDDCSGHVLSFGGWKHVAFQMRYEPKRVDPTGKVLWCPDPRDPRSEGELLWPQLFTEQKVRNLELRLGPYGAAGQLQQLPSPEGGGLFKRGWFSIVDALPAKRRIIRGWDTGATEGGGDDTIGVKIGEADGIFYVEDCIAVNLGPGDVDDLIHTTAIMDGYDVAQREEKEPGSSGLAVIAARAKRLRGYDYAGVQVSKDKVTRAKPFRAQCEAGNVKLLRGEWNEPYLQELEHFPVGKKDNRVDASSCSFNSFVLEEENIPEEVTW